MGTAQSAMAPENSAISAKLFTHETNPTHLLLRTQKTLVTTCKQQDLSQSIPRLNTECAYKVVVTAIQRMSQLYPRISGEMGLLGSSYPKSDHEANVILNLELMCPTHGDQELDIVGGYTLEGRAACAYTILLKFVRAAGGEVTDAPDDQTVPGDTFHTKASADVDDTPLDTKVVFSVICVIGLLVALVMIYNINPSLLSNPVTWLIIFITLLGVCMVIVDPTSTRDARTVAQHLGTDTYYREHTDPVRNKAQYEKMFGRPLAKRYETNADGSKVDEEGYFGEHANYEKVKAMQDILFGK